MLELFIFRFVGCHGDTNDHAQEKDQQEEAPNDDVFHEPVQEAGDCLQAAGLAGKEEQENSDDAEYKDDNDE